MRQAAAIAELSDKTVRLWVQSGKLPARVVRNGPLLVKFVKIRDVMALKRKIRSGRKPSTGR